MKTRQQYPGESSSRPFFWTTTLALAVITTAGFHFNATKHEVPSESATPASHRPKANFTSQRWNHDRRSHMQKPDEVAESAAIEAALQAIKEEELEQQREALLRLAKDIPLRQVGLALSLAPAASSVELENDFTRALLTRWLETDPTQAADYASSVSAPDQRQALLSIVGEQWAQSDSSAAKAWVSQLPTGPGQSGAIENVVSVLAAANLDDALDFAWSLTEPAARTTALSTAALKANDADTSAALAWVAQWPEQPERETVWTDIWEQWVRSEPQQAAEYAMSSTKNASAKPRWEEAVASWAGADGEATVRWASTQPEAQRDQLFAIIAKQWSQREPAAAAMLARTLPPGETQNATILDIVKHWAGRDVESVASWIDLFQEGDLRTQANQHIDSERRFRQRTNPNDAQP